MTTVPSAPTTPSPVGPRGAVTPLQGLYAGRAVFALAWAALFATHASPLSALTVTLLVLYPLVDLAAAAFDLRSARGSRPSRALVVNLAVSLLAAIGLAIATTSGVPAVIATWGAWAVVTGATQLLVAIRRRGLGGQWPMIVSGGLSVLAGAGFLSMSAGTDPALAPLAGYATLGGIFFAVSAIQLHRGSTGRGSAST